MNILSIENFSKTYHSLNNEILAVNNVSFEINEGDFISIIGPSGCGKSTILNAISGLDKEYEGIINVNNLSIGYMFQNDTLFEWLTILDNCLLGLRILKKLNKENIEYVTNLLKKYELYEFRNKYPSQLSGGMRQRVALIRTLATKPDILLLDEPFSALDYQTRLKVNDDVYNIIKKEKKTVLMVTHDIAEAISMSNKVLVLSNRPSTIKTIHYINLPEYLLPIEKRKLEDFSLYFNLIWKEMDINNVN